MLSGLGLERSPLPVPSLLVVLSFFIAWKACGQEFSISAEVDRKDIPPLDTAGLPELNRKVIYYVDSVLGTKIGRGNCRKLTYQAAAVARGGLKKIMLNFKRKTFTGIGRFISQQELKPGDFVYYYFGHTGIIYRKLENSEYLFAHQNATKPSVVVITLVYFEPSDKIVGRKYSFFRMVPE